MIKEEEKLVNNFADEIGQPNQMTGVVDANAKSERGLQHDKTVGVTADFVWSNKDK